MTHRLAAWAGGLGLVLAFAAPAPAQDAAALAAGKKLYSDAGCHNCHGNRGQGGGGVDFPSGPSLRLSQLDHDSMAEIVRCGIPNTRMPAWLKGAYSETVCYGEPLGPAPSGTMVTGILTEDEIATLVDYIQSSFMQPTKGASR